MVIIFRLLAGVCGNLFTFAADEIQNFLFDLVLLLDQRLFKLCQRFLSLGDVMPLGSNFKLNFRSDLSRQLSLHDFRNLELCTT